MSTTIKFSDKARESLKRGVDKVADAVKVSLGAEGRNVIIPSQQGGYIITKDGVSIAKSIFPKDEFEAIGASLIKEAAQRTNSQAGDSTTTSTVIAQAIFNEGLNSIEDNKFSSVEIKKGIDKATEEVIEVLKKHSVEVKGDLKNVATISANGDSELGELISSAFEKIGKHGTVITDKSDTSKTYVELKEGVQLDRGFFHPIFATDPIKDICELDNPSILLHRGKLEKGDAIVKLFETVFSNPKNSLLIIADDIDPFVLSTIVENVRKGAIRGKICVVKSPQILKIEKDLMNDISILTGAKVVSDVDGVKLSPKVLGRLEKCIVSRDDTVLVGDKSNLDDLVKVIKEKIDITENKFEKEELQERLSRITGGVATLYVGAKSDSELKEKQDRIEDSINATRSALEEGISPGGGVALLNASEEVFRKYITFGEDWSDSFKLGYEILLRSVTAPFSQILLNAGMRESIDEELYQGEGFNVKTGEKVVMIKAGIIDPTKAVRCALENASSVASTFLTTEAIVAREV